MCVISAKVALTIMCAGCLIASSSSLLSQTKSTQPPRAALVPVFDSAGSLSFGPPGEMAPGEFRALNSVALSPDGHMLATGDGYCNVKLWDVDGKKLIRSMSGHSGAVQVVAFSPDGRVVASGSKDKTIKVWDAASGQLIKTLSGHGGWVTNLAISPDGKTIASTSEGAWVRLWDISGGREIRRFQREADGIVAGYQSVAFSPDGKRLIAGGDDIRIWDVASGRTIQSLSLSDAIGVNTLSLSQDGQTFAAGYDIANADRGRVPSIQIWDTGVATPLRSMKDSDLSSIALSKDGQMLVSVGDLVRVRGVKNGNVLQTLKLAQGCLPVTASLSQDNRLLAVGCGSGNIASVYFWQKH